MEFVKHHTFQCNETVGSNTELSEAKFVAVV